MSQSESGVEPQSQSTEPPSLLTPNLPPIKLKYIPLPQPLALPSDPSTLLTMTATSTNRPPCRRCLQDALPSETMRLISYDPFPNHSTSPYRGAGPIFVHADGQNCRVFEGDRLPQRQLERLLSVRAYDRRDMLVCCEVVDGIEFEGVVGGMLADERARYVNVHNAKPGCFAVRVERA